MDDGKFDGAISADGLISGGYVHGLLGLAEQRAAWLRRLGGAGGGVDHAANVDAALDEIAAMLETHLDINGLIALARSAQVQPL